MCVHRARINQVVVLPDIAQQLLARLHPAAALRQHGQELEFCGRQLDLLSAPAHQMARQVNDEIPEVQGPGLFRAGLSALKNLFDAQHQFPRTERFGQIIVRPQLQPQHAVNLRCFCRKHEDGDARRGGIAAQHFANFQSIHLRQHQIEHDQARQELPRLLERRCAIRGRDYFKSGLLQIELDQLDRFGFIFNNQNFLFHNRCHSTRTDAAAS